MSKVIIILTNVFMLCSVYTSAQQPGSGFALNFDGVNDFANGNAADLQAITDNFTIEFWVQSSTTRTTKTEANTGITGTGGNGQKYVVYPSHGGASNAGVGVSIGTNGVSVYEHGGGYMPALLVHDQTLNGWNHIAVVYTAKQPSLYINGILVRTGITSARAACFPSARLGGAGYGYHQGDLDEFRIWSASRTQAEIRDNMCQKLTGAEANLVRYYKLDEGAGTTLTDATGTQNATMSNMAPASDWVTSGAAIGNTSVHSYPANWGGNALDFDGSNDYVNGFAGDLTAILDNFTMEMWVNPTGTITIHGEQNCAGCVSGTGTPNQRLAIYPQHGGATPGVAGAGISVGTNGIQVYEHAAGYMPALASYSGAISGWNHIAIVYNAKQPSIYLNGMLVRTGLTSGRTNVFPGCHIGGIIYGFYQGQLDDIRIWNYARTATEIGDDLCSELTGTEPGLVRYYNFNDGAGTTAVDGTGTFNGTLTNMAPASDWVASGAGNCVNGTLSHTSPELDNLSIGNFQGYSKGVHLYHVDDVPNDITGISGLGDNDHYYGVFKAGEEITSTYTASYTYTENDAFQNSWSGMDENDLRLYTRSDNAATPWTNSGAAINTTANTLTASAMSTEFIIGILGGSGLPIELLSFEAEMNNGQVNLSWKTAAEINNDYFIIERSHDAMNWENIAYQQGAGNSSNLIVYSDVDKAPLKGISYYRLKQFDFDGSSSISDIKLVNNSNQEQVITIFPNPVDQQAEISIQMVGFSGENIQLQILDIGGKMIHNMSFPAIGGESRSIITLNNKLNTGLYFIKIAGPDKTVVKKVGG
jgi:hypothetical protein